MTPHWADGATPIATPGQGPAAYQLKDWTAADSMRLVTALERYAHDDDVPAPAHGRWNFPKDYRPVREALQEAAYRFPDLVSQDTFLWHWAMTNAIEQVHESDSWVLSTIGRYLNQGRLSLDQLDVGLRPLGFKVADQQPAPNLFGDGRLATVVQLDAQDTYASDGLFFAVAQDAAGQYTVTPIYSDWDLEMGEDQIVDIQDRTRNGVPEVLLNIAASSGSLCFAHILSFEWQGTQFVDLTHGQIRYSCDGNGDWSIGRNVSDTLTISAGDYLAGTDLFAWNGSYYELTGRNLSNETCEYYPKDFLYGWDDYRRGIEQLQANLAEQQTGLDPGCPDFLRFQIGLTYLRYGDLTLAHTTFDALATTPSDPTVPIVSRAAGAFLANFHSPLDIYKACQSAEAVMLSAAAALRGADGKLAPADMQTVWGYSTASQEPELCDLAGEFRIAVTAIAGSDLADPIRTLSAAGVDLRASPALDLDGDPHPDWVVLVHSSGTTWDYWALINNGQSLQPVFLDGVDLKDRAPDPGPLNIEVVLAPGGAHLVVLFDSHDLSIFQIALSDSGYTSYHIIGRTGVDQYSLRPATTTLQLNVVYSATATTSTGSETFTWNGPTHAFEPSPLFGGSIFADGKPGAAVPRLLNTLKDLSADADTRAYYEPRGLYLLGLAYEFAGDKTQAANTYWQLWHQYPDSEYALIAQARLEPVSP